MNIEFKIKNKFSYSANPLNRYHAHYQITVNFFLVSSISVIISLYALLSDNTNLVIYSIAFGIAMFYVLIWKSIFFPKGFPND